MHLVNNFKRNISGIILLDKPKGISSTTLVQTVKNLFFASKAGHTGTLDRLATGMLPICIGEATKFSQYLLCSDKKYRVTAKLGVSTDTFDAEGKILSIKPVFLTKKKLIKTLNHFIGKSEQTPPMFSALKHKGKPLYKYARKGITITRAKRPIYIYNLQLYRWSLTEIELYIHCSKGTYIRTIIDDLGKYLTCGAHVTDLRRLSVAHYSYEYMVNIQYLKNKKQLSDLDLLLLPTESILSKRPIINLSSYSASLLRHGQSVIIKNNTITGIVRLTEGENNKFIGVANINLTGYLKPVKLIIDNNIS